MANAILNTKRLNSARGIVYVFSNWIRKESSHRTGNQRWIVEKYFVAKDWRSDPSAFGRCDVRVLWMCCVEQMLKVPLDVSLDFSEMVLESSLSLSRGRA